MTADDRIEVVKRLRAMGARRAKVGDLEVEFADDAGDMLQALEQGVEQGRAEILRRLSEDQRARILQQIEEELQFGSG